MTDGHPLDTASCSRKGRFREPRAADIAARNRACFSAQDLPLAKMSKPASPGKKPAPLPKPLQFAFGGIAGMAATFVVQPIDLVKTRMQLSTTAGAAVASKNA